MTRHRWNVETPMRDGTLLRADIYFPESGVDGGPYPTVLQRTPYSKQGPVYVEGARALGAPIPRLVLRHILPNSTTPVLVQASVLMAIAILVEAALSFLGVGVKPPTPSLGLMLADGRGFMLQAPWVVVFPGLAIMAAVLGFNMLADGLRDWLDPQAVTR